MAEENQQQEQVQEPTQNLNKKKLSVENVTEIRGLIQEALKANNSQFSKTLEDNLGTFRGEMEALTRSLSEKKTAAETDLRKYELATKLREEDIDIRFLDFLPLDADPKVTEEKINVIKDILDSYAKKIIQSDMVNNPFIPSSGGIPKDRGISSKEFQKQQFEAIIRSK